MGLGERSAFNKRKRVQHYCPCPLVRDVKRERCLYLDKLIGVPDMHAQGGDAVAACDDVAVGAPGCASAASPVCVCLGGKHGKAGGICVRHRRRPRSRSFRRSGRAANELRVPFYFTFLLHKVCYATCRRWIFRGSTSSAVPPCALGLQPHTGLVLCGLQIPDGLVVWSCTRHPGVWVRFPNERSQQGEKLVGLSRYLAYLVI